MKAIKHLTFLAIIALATTSCMMKKADAFKTKDNEVVSIIGMSGEFDGEKIGKWGEFCDLQFKDDNGNLLGYLRDVDTGYVIIKGQPGKTNLVTMGCLSNRTFYNKTRKKDFHNLSFVAEKGYVNYLGDVKFVWAPDSFKAGDLLSAGAGSLTEDGGKLILKLNDNLPGAKDYIKKQFPEDYDNLKFKKVDFDKNAYFIK